MREERGSRSFKGRQNMCGGNDLDFKGKVPYGRNLLYDGNGG